MGIQNFRACSLSRLDRAGANAMAQLYILDIMKKTGTTEKQTSYDVVSKILIIDDVDDADDKWMMFEGSANKIAAGQGQWFRSSSYNKVILTGDIGNRMIRNELVINYLSWPMQRGQIGTCTAAKPIRVTDDSKEYYYHVDKVQ
jgi:hypothetical protein